ncbi:hypothetical protein [Microbacterium sp. 1.5R]|uniref:arsenate reductase/protein-tyrosine-phosphatase family protein n=1 Tax=Microbacterium sp. 1.5R TaxID=1916917 RepID=UPI0011A8DEF9|nr:hypothetical protein [Microbacterium sp. 1.5R]
MRHESVLAVCAANVCRSPVIAYLASRQLQSAGFVVPPVLASAGVSARGNVAVCHTMRARLAGEPGWDDLASAHRSSRMTADDVEQAELILAATAAERGAVALMRPDARARSFTLLEAAALAEHAVARGIRGVALEVGALAETMNAQRGRVEPPEPGRWWNLRSGGIGFDIPDAHTSRARHGRVFDTIDDAARRWGASIARLTASA